MAGKIVFLVISLLVSGATWYLFTVLRASGLRDRRMTGFGEMCVILPFWISLNAVSYIVTSEAFSAAYVLKAIPLNIIPYISCWFYLNFSESKAAGSRFIRYFSIGMPALALILLFTSPLHGLYYISIGNPPQTGPLFLAHLAATSVYMLVVYVTLFRYVVKNLRSNPLLIIGGAGALVPVILYAVYLFFPRALPFDFTPIGYFMTIVFVTYATYHSRLRSTKPGILGDTLAKIANSRVISAGLVEDAARLISREACLALDTYRVKVWKFDSESQTLKSIACYNSHLSGHTAQEDYDMQHTAEYIRHLTSERIIALSNVKEAMAGIKEPYHPEVCAALIAPIRTGHELAGVINIEQEHNRHFPTKREWSMEEQTFASSLADLMVLTITNAERQSLIRRLEEEQKALRESEENVQLLLDSAPLSVNLIDKDFQCAFVNEEAVRMYGLSSKQEYINLFATGKLSKEKGIGHIRKAYEEGYCRCEMTFQQPGGGEELPCELTMVRVMYKGDYAIAAYARDLREEKAAAEKLIETEEARRNMQAILDMLPIGIRIVSIDDLTMLYSNRACLDMFGCTSFEEQVKNQSVFRFMPEFQPDGRATADIVGEFFERGEQTAEVQCIRLNGEPFLCRVTSCTIDYGGSPASLAAMEDITEEHNRRHMLETIAHKEQEANQLKSRFLATMSHEIRTPMNAVIGMTEIALREDDIEAKNEHIKTVKQAASTLLAIVNDILDFSKIEAGKLEIVPRDYMVASMLEDVVSIIKTRITGKQVRFAVNVDSEIPAMLHGDETKVNQAVLNVLSNAVKFTEEGFVTLGVYADFAGNDTVNLIFEVTDTGIGIKPEDMEKLFTGFVQFDPDKNRDTEGTGLGLAITHSIVKAMDGEISAKSEYGKGSTFTIKIPQKYHSRNPLGEEEGSLFRTPDIETIAGFSAPDARVLIVDDIRTNLAVAQGLLAPYGIQADMCMSGKSAIDAVEAQQYDLIFMDHKMPGMDGVEATRRIREMGIGIPVIALTANAVSGVMEMFIENGFNDFLPKPIDIVKLNGILEKWIPGELKIPNPR